MDEEVKGAPVRAPPVQESKSERLINMQDMAKFLEILGNKSEGRGVPVADQTPAQRQGLNPQNPKYFGVQQK
jgi:hypothetical protein